MQKPIPFNITKWKTVLSNYRITGLMITFISECKKKQDSREKSWIKKYNNTTIIIFYKTIFTKLFAFHWKRNKQELWNKCLYVTKITSWNYCILVHTSHLRPTNRKRYKRYIRNTINVPVRRRCWYMNNQAEEAAYHISFILKNKNDFAYEST